MVKHYGERKCDLIDLLNAATTSKERNRVVKQLRKFDPCPRRELDDEFEPKDCSCKKYNQTQYFMCWRCDKPKTTTVKVMWSSPKGTFLFAIRLKIICNTCYYALNSNIELQRARKENAQYYSFMKKK
ncbi:hypothetical protein CSUI_002017 [Cystoisospora suis]|uniref:Uncharacterized protein n=1 Tax=Cystoisospora suis TaxID=483139 RepID=A0A2C6LAX9_9APIC|nr:hypothetical protein CSUI_002017 [Cystoisospora suis]